jgi:hypothetical protein
MTNGHKMLGSPLVCALILCFLGIPACRKAPTGPSRSGQSDASGWRCLDKRMGNVIFTCSADAHFVNWDGRLALLVLCDFSGRRVGGSGGNSGRFDGYSDSTTGRRVEWSWETVDGKSGTVVINGQKYDRSSGGLFLVYTKGEKLRIVQLKREFEGNEKGTLGSLLNLDKLAATDPDIEQFVAGAAEERRAAEGRPGGF